MKPALDNAGHSRVFGQRKGHDRAWFDNNSLQPRMCLVLCALATIALMPNANTEAMQYHLDGIAQMVETGRHAVIVIDRAAWHMSKQLKCPDNLSLLPLPAYSPELNPVEQVWQQLRITIGRIAVLKTMMIL